MSKFARTALTCLALGATVLPLAACAPTSADKRSDIKEGTCLTTSGGNTVVECSQKHDVEAYFRENLPGKKYPGESGAKTLAEQTCQQEFESYVGKPSDSSSLNYSYSIPTAENWKNGDHAVICFLADPSGQVTGSLKNSKK